MDGRWLPCQCSPPCQTPQIAERPLEVCEDCPRRDRPLENLGEIRFCQVVRGLKWESGSSRFPGLRSMPLSLMVRLGCSAECPAQVGTQSI